MMKQQTMNEIRQVGIEALIEALGPVGAVRFFQQFDMGKGDYTKEREHLLAGMTVESIWKEMDKQEE